MHLVIGQLLLFIMALASIRPVEAQTQSRALQAVSDLLMNQHCTIFFLGLEKYIIQHFLSNSNAFSRTKVSPAFIASSVTPFDITKLKKESFCWIGVAAMKRNLAIQTILSTTHNKQIVLIGETNETNFDIDLMEQHHPTTIIRPLDEDNAVSIEVICHGKRKVNLGILNSNDQQIWTLPDGPNLDRICNKGKHALFGKSIVASVFALPPFLTVHDNMNYHGIVIDIFTSLADHLKFKYKIILRSNWFQFFPNVTVGESMGDVLNSKADVSLEQHRAVGPAFGDMTTFTYMEKSYFIELKPAPTSVIKNIFIPFDLYTWTSLIISLVLISIFLYGILKVIDTSSLKLGYKDVFLLVFGVIFQEYHTYSLKGKPRAFKMLRFIWVSVTLLLVMSFSATLKSSLVRKNFEKPTLTLDEMIEKDLVIHTSTTSMDWFASPLGQLEPINRRLQCQAKKKESIYITSNNVNGQISKLLLEHGGATNNFQYSIEVLKGQYLRNATDFPFTTIPQRFRDISYGMLFKKYDPRVEYFNLPLGWMKDCGIIEYFFKRELPYMGMGEHVDLKEEKLIVEHFYVPLVFYLVGKLLSCVAYLFEIVQRKKEMSHKVKDIKIPLATFKS